MHSEKLIEIGHRCQIENLAMAHHFFRLNALNNHLGARLVESYNLTLWTLRKQWVHSALTLVRYSMALNSEHRLIVLSSTHSVGMVILVIHSLVPTVIFTTIYFVDMDVKGERNTEINEGYRFCTHQLAPLSSKVLKYSCPSLLLRAWKQCLHLNHI